MTSNLETHGILIALSNAKFRVFNRFRWQIMNFASIWPHMSPWRHAGGQILEIIEFYEHHYIPSLQFNWNAKFCIFKTFWWQLRTIWPLRAPMTSVIFGIIFSNFGILTLPLHLPFENNARCQVTCLNNYIQEKFWQHNWHLMIFWGTYKGGPNPTTWWDHACFSHLFEITNFIFIS